MIYCFDRFELDENRRELRDGGKPVALQPLAFDMLALLVRNHDRVVQKQELLDQLWPDGFVSEASLQRTISLVRAALGDDQHEVIRTFSGRGYRFCAALQSTDGHGQQPKARDAEDAQAQPAEALTEGRNARRPGQPRIQYARTSDGVNIAYWTMGQGRPFISMGDAPSSHIRMELDIPELRSWYEELSRDKMLVRFDQRGGGLSDREVPELSLDAFTRDLEAVADSLGGEKFILFAYVDSGPVAIKYAAENPDRVSHLILWCAYARRDEYNDLAQITAVRALMDLDYALYLKTLAHLCLGWAAGEPVRQWAELMTEGWSRDILARTYAAIADYDVRDRLPMVKMPTLVMHPRGLDWFPEDASRKIAAGIPKARLALLDNAAALSWVGDWQAVLDVIEEFLDDN